LCGPHQEGTIRRGAARRSRTPSRQCRRGTPAKWTGAGGASARPGGRGAKAAAALLPRPLPQRALPRRQNGPTGPLRSRPVAPLRAHLARAARVDLEVGSESVVLSTEERERLDLLPRRRLEYHAGALDARHRHRHLEPVLREARPRAHRNHKCRALDLGAVDHHGADAPRGARALRPDALHRPDAQLGAVGDSGVRQLGAQFERRHLRAAILVHQPRLLELAVEPGRAEVGARAAGLLARRDAQNGNPTVGGDAELRRELFVQGEADLVQLVRDAALAPVASQETAEGACGRR